MSIISANTTPTYSLAGLLLVAILAAGLFLSQLGRPLNSPVFTIHKLASIGLAVLLYFMVRNSPASLAATGMSTILALPAGIGTLLLLVSGALLSLDIMPQNVMLRVHNIAAAFFAGPGGALLYLLNR